MAFRYFISGRIAFSSADSKFYYSDDGDSWTEATVPLASAVVTRAVEYKDVYYVSADGELGGSAVYSTTDFTTYTVEFSSSTAAGAFLGVVGDYLWVRDNLDDRKLWRFDGSAWVDTGETNDVIPQGKIGDDYFIIEANTVSYWNETLPNFIFSPTTVIEDSIGNNRTGVVFNDKLYTIDNIGNLYSIEKPGTTIIVTKVESTIVTGGSGFAGGLATDGASLIKVLIDLADFSQIALSTVDGINYTDFTSTLPPGFGFAVPGYLLDEFYITSLRFSDFSFGYYKTTDLINYSPFTIVNAAYESKNLDYIPPQPGDFSINRDVELSTTPIITASAINTDIFTINRDVSVNTTPIITASAINTNIFTINRDVELSTTPIITASDLTQFNLVYSVDGSSNIDIEESLESKIIKGIGL